MTLATVTLQICPGHQRVKSKHWRVSLVTSWGVELQSSSYSEWHVSGCRRNEQRVELWLLVSAYAVHRPDPAGDTRYTPLQCSAVTQVHSRQADGAMQTVQLSLTCATPLQQSSNHAVLRLNQESLQSQRTRLKLRTKRLVEYTKLCQRHRSRHYTATGWALQKTLSTTGAVPRKVGSNSTRAGSIYS